MATHSASASLNLPADKTMLDAVMFAASLVSKSSDIDTQLDRVRAITSRRSSAELTDQDNKTLQEVYGYLEEYLVEKEPLRSFTYESVRQRTAAYLRGNVDQSEIRRPLIVMWAATIGSALAAIIIPDSILSPAIKPTLAISLFFVAIDLGAAWMFWTGIQNFKNEIRQAYLPISVGIALIGIMLLQSPLVVALGQDHSIWFHYITSGITIPIADTLIYIGMRRFAQLGGMRGRLLSGKLVFLFCVVAAVVINLIPRPYDPDVPLWAIAFSLSVLSSGIVLGVVTAKITNNVRGALSKAYKQPMAWFMAMLVVSVFSCVQYAYLQIIATPEHPFQPNVAELLILVISALITLKAGTSFHRIGSRTTQ